MNEYYILFIRSVVTYFTLVVCARIMGRKQISQLTYFDYVVGIIIGSIASTASVEKNVDMYEGIFCIIIWSFLTILISKITFKNIKLRLLADSRPLLMIDKGKVFIKI